MLDQADDDILVTQQHGILSRYLAYVDGVDKYVDGVHHRLYASQVGRTDNTCLEEA